MWLLLSPFQRLVFVFSCRDKARVEVAFSDLDRRNFAQILRKKIL